MVEKKVIVQLSIGLHARPAASFVQEAGRFSADIFVQQGHRKVNAKSIMGIMSLAVAKGTEITIIADGQDAQDAVDTLAEIVSQNG